MSLSMKRSRGSISGSSSAVFDATSFELYRGSVSPLVRPASTASAGLDCGGDDDTSAAASPPPAKYTRVGDDAFVRVASSTASLSTLADDDTVATRAPVVAVSPAQPLAIARQTTTASAVALAALPATPLWGTGAALLPPPQAAAPAARVATWAALTGALHTASAVPPPAAAAAGVHRAAARNSGDGTVGGGTAVAAGSSRAIPPSSPLATAAAAAAAAGPPPRSSAPLGATPAAGAVATFRPAFCGATAQVVGGESSQSSQTSRGVPAPKAQLASRMAIDTDAPAAAAGGGGAGASGGAPPILSWLVTQHRRRQQVNVLVTEHGMHVSEAEEIAASMHPHSAAGPSGAAAAFDGAAWRGAAPRATYGDGQWVIGSSLDEQQQECRCPARTARHGLDSQDHDMKAATGSGVGAGVSVDQAGECEPLSVPAVAGMGSGALVTSFPWSLHPAASQRIAIDTDAVRADKYGEAGGGASAVAVVDGVAAAQAAGLGRGSRPARHVAVANARKVGAATELAAAPPVVQTAAAQSGSRDSQNSSKRMRPSPSALWLSKLSLASAASSPAGPQGRPAPIRASSSVSMSVDALGDSGDESSSSSPLSVAPASSPVAGSRSPASAAAAVTSARPRAFVRSRMVVRPLSAPLAARIARWRRNNDEEAGEEVARKAVGSTGSAALHSGRFDAVALAAFGSAGDLAGLTAEQAEEVRHERSKLLKRRVRARTKIDAAQRLVHERALQAQVHALRTLHDAAAADALSMVLNAALDGALVDAPGTPGGGGLQRAGAEAAAFATLQRLVLGLAPDSVDGQMGASSQAAMQRAAQTAVGRMFAAAGELDLAQASSLLPSDTTSLVAATAMPLVFASPHASSALAALQLPVVAGVGDPVATLSELIETLRLGDPTGSGTAIPKASRAGRSRRGSAGSGAASSSSVIVDAASGFHVHKSTVTSALQRNAAAGYPASGGASTSTSQRASRSSTRGTTGRQISGAAGGAAAGPAVGDDVVAAVALQPIVDPTAIPTEFAGRDVPAVLRSLLRTHGTSKTALPADYAHETLARCMDAHVVDGTLLDALQAQAAPVRNDMLSSSLTTAAGEMLGATAAALARGGDVDRASPLAKDLLSVLSLSPEQMTAVATAFAGPSTAAAAASGAEVGLPVATATATTQYFNIERSVIQLVRAAIDRQPAAASLAGADGASGTAAVFRVPLLRGEAGTKLAAIVAQQPLSWAEGPSSLDVDPVDDTTPVVHHRSSVAASVRVPTTSTAWCIGDVTVSDHAALQAGLNVDVMLHDLIGVPIEY